MKIYQSQKVRLPKIRFPQKLHRALVHKVLCPILGINFGAGLKGGGMVRGPDRTWRVGGIMELKKVGCFVNFIRGKYNKMISSFFVF